LERLDGDGTRHAIEAFQLASAKLSVATRVVTRVGEGG